MLLDEIYLLLIHDLQTASKMFENSSRPSKETDPHDSYDTMHLVISAFGF